MSTTTQQPASPAGTRFDAAALHELVERWHAAWNSHDPQRVAELCTPDVELDDPSLEAPVRGLEGIRRLMGSLGRACPDFRFETTAPPSLTEDGQGAAMPWRCEGTMTGRLEPPGYAPTGRRVAFHGVDLWRLDGGRVARTEAIYDQLPIAVQIGAAPPPGSGGERLGVLLQRLAARRMRRRAAAA